MLVLLAGWAALTIVHVFSVVYARQFKLDHADNLMARKHVTQIRILKRAADVLITLLTAAVALMTFESVRHYGVSLLASAGAAGLILGLALQPILKNIVAGIQIAMTQPIRIDDAVVVEGEWGWIEEITSTYVVIKIWDWRRLIVPLTYFVENTFQNWTRENASILGSVFLRVDYRAPLDAIRARFEEILRETERFDGKAQVMQVTEVDGQSVELRFLMSAHDSPTCWDLRCEVREKLLTFLQEDHPDSLPRVRGEIDKAPPETERFSNGEATAAIS